MLALPTGKDDEALIKVLEYLWLPFERVVTYREVGMNLEWQKRYERFVLFLATGLQWTADPGLAQRFLHPFSRGQDAGAVWPFESWRAYGEATEALGANGAKEFDIEAEYRIAREEIAAHEELGVDAG